MTSHVFARPAGDEVRICGIVNVTPDSFSDGGEHLSTEAAVEHGLTLVAAGAHMLDIGGESTRPGAVAPTVAEELRRVVPVITELARRTSVPISIDTSRPRVMQAAFDAGARFLNDVRAFRAPGALAVAAELNVPICVMHMRGTPRTMQEPRRFADDVVDSTRTYLRSAIERCLAAGVRQENIVVDPGFGFGKSAEQNFELLAALPAVVELGAPVLVGLSRKSMIGHVTGREVDGRVFGSVVAAVLAAQNGASIVRVHDVAATADGLAVLAAAKGSRGAAAMRSRAS